MRKNRKITRILYDLLAIKITTIICPPRFLLLVKAIFRPRELAMKLRERRKVGCLNFDLPHCSACNIHQAHELCPGDALNECITIRKELSMLRQQVPAFEELDSRPDDADVPVRFGAADIPALPELLGVHDDVVLKKAQLCSRELFFRLQVSDLTALRKLDAHFASQLGTLRAKDGVAIGLDPIHETAPAKREVADWASSDGRVGNAKRLEETRFVEVVSAGRESDSAKAAI
jgi:hypothetical protein